MYVIPNGAPLQVVPLSESIEAFGPKAPNELCKLYELYSLYEIKYNTLAWTKLS